MKLIETIELSKVYKTVSEDVHALTKINLEIEEGELCAISGPSGSGKTTLLNLIALLDKPTEGDVKLDGVLYQSLSENQRTALRRDQIGMIFQSFNLIPVLSAWENVELALNVLPKETLEKKLGIKTKEDRKKICFKSLEEVGLKGLENRRPNELSGGQQQRISIARAIVKQPKVLLADEPTANLDRKNGEKILEVIGLLNKEKGLTCIYSSHDKLVLDHVRRIIRLVDGRVTDV
ncbi:MAG: ABC transporter ATP-binding protein [Sphaerochaetaceae bacterium]